VSAKILYIDMDNVLVDFRSGITKLPEEVAAKYDRRLDEVPGIFSLMCPMPGAVESFKELASLYDTYILSTAPWENPSAWSDKLLWVKRHLGDPAYKRLILSHHKNLNDGHYLVDDRIKNGADRFRGEHIHFGTPQFPDWKSVVSYLKNGATT
jgi:5'(3')-deoxyribonucleotidase